MIPTVMTGRLIDERLSNIGELKRREIQLERLSRRLELALDTSQIGVWELNIETDELFWDDRMNELYGYPPMAARATICIGSARCIPTTSPARAGISSAPSRPTDSYQSEYRMLLDNGEVRHVRESGMVYKDPGEPARIVGRQLGRDRGRDAAREA